MHQIVCRLGLRPRPQYGSLQRSPRPLADLGNGPPKKGKKGGEGESKGKEGGEGKGKSFPLVIRIFFKFWWDQDLDELKSRSVISCDIWKAAGRPRSGPIFRDYRRDKSVYRHGIRSKRISDTEIYTNELHEALMAKQGAS